MSLLKTQAVETGAVSRTTWDGRDHLVVPVVMIVEGVLNGELVTTEAMSDLPESWDGRPVVINHPTERGVHVSANNPAQLEQAIGTIFNTHLDGNKLKAEAWIDVEKAPDIVQAFEAGELMEVSTGYFAGAIPEEGTFNGSTYSGVQTGIRPDHLAILPNDTGACSVADGCGAPRINTRTTKEEVASVKGSLSPMTRFLTFMRRMFTPNAEDASFNEIWQALSKALQDAHGYDAWVLDFYDNTVVYEIWHWETGTSEQFQQAYTINETTLEVTLEGEPEPVVQRVEYVPTADEAGTNPEAEPVVNAGARGVKAGPRVAHPNHPTLAVQSSDCDCATPKKKENRMKKNRAERRARIKAHEASKEDIIDELIDLDENEVTESDREALEALPQETLENLLPEEVLEEVEEEAEEEAAPVVNLDTYVAGIPDADAREFILDGIRTQRQRRQDLIQSLTANKRNELSRDELEGMRTNQLERLARMIEPEVSYAGRATPRSNATEEPLTTMSTHRKEVN